ncbi:hypothetical protein OHA25_36965 [Nonomuraea sp. NBC_00507]|uniref:hypothetical protein n=1 Tax=Nonomuraea sp. NBC_00507 TaxID=2976002 RepID=UPI002E1986E5
MARMLHGGHEPPPAASAGLDLDALIARGVTRTSLGQPVEAEWVCYPTKRASTAFGGGTMT